MTEQSEIAVELREHVAKFPPVALDRRPILWFARLATRFSKTVPTEGVVIENVKDGNVRVRVYRPTGASSGAGMLWMHGGGMIAGDPIIDDALLGPVVKELGVVIVSVAYRRAPEHPYPAPVDDCEAGWNWFQRNAERFGVQRDRIAIAGESGGGSLAAATAQRLRRTPGAVQPRAQWLMCPMLDDRTAARSDIGDQDHRIWNNRNNRYAWRSYLNAEPGSANVPVGAVPARTEDLRGLPPTWIGIAALDLFAAEDQEYARSLREAGVPVEIDLVEGAVHGFQTIGMTTRLAQDYLTRARAWLGNALAVTPQT